MDSAEAGRRAPRTSDRGLWLVSFLVALVIVVATFAVATYYSETTRGIAPTASAGLSASANPSISVKAIGLLGGRAAPLSGVTVSVFSPVPTAGLQDRLAVDLRSASPADNGYYDLLFQGTTDTSGNLAGSVGAAFGARVSEWAQVITPLTRTVSLTIDASYVAANGSVYQYYNNLPYDPRAPPSLFVTTVAFNLAHPIGLVPFTLAPTSVTPQIPPGGCPPGVWTTLNTTTKKGALPVASANNSASSLGNNYVDLADAIIKQDMQFSFNSAQSVSSTQSASGASVTMSNGPSWSGDDQAYGGQNPSIAAFPASKNPAATNAIIYIDNATLYVINQRYTWYAFNGRACIQLNRWYTTLEITTVQSNNYNFRTMPQDSFFGQFINQIGDLQLADQYTLPTSYAVTLSTLQTYATGYTSAANAEQKFENAAMAFTAALGVEIAMMELLSLCGPLGCTAGSVAAGIAATAAAMGFVIAILQCFQTISFSLTVHQTIDMVGYTNDWTGSGGQGTYSLFFYESGQQNTLVFPNGTLYQANMPVIHVVACAPGTSPGHGC